MKPTMIKAIETVYDGYRFRSRLEARWAVFFDTLGIEYRYEPEGYNLEGIWYLPDFFLPKQQCWLEIKPDLPTHEEREKAIRLSIASRKPVIILAGDVWKDVNGFGFAPVTGAKEEIIQGFADNIEKIYWLSTSECFSVDEFGDPWGVDFTRGYIWSNAYWAQCNECLVTGIISVNCFPCEDYDVTFECFSSDGSHLTEAFKAARQARFERVGGK